jgi:nitrate reductase NapD
MATGEYNISSLILHGRPEAMAAITKAVEAIPAAEVHAATPAGKMVITLETDGDQAILGHIDTINRISGVISTALVYHQIDEDPDPTKETAA